MAEIYRDGHWVGSHFIHHFDYVMADDYKSDCDAYEAKIATLESRLARIAALVKPIPVADLVEAGTEAPRLLAERHAKIRAILEDEG